MEELFKVIRKLQDQVEELKAEIVELKKENAALKEKLGLNSKNSSIPSSKELYKLKKEKPKSERKIGGQPGHKGVTRDKMVADEMIHIALDSTCSCGGEISLSNKPYIHQKIELPKITPLVTEYQLQHGRCSKCRKRSSARLPGHVAPDMFGPKIKTIISSLTAFYKNSKHEVGKILKDIFNLNISIGSISNSEHRVSVKCKESYEEIEQNIAGAKLVHIDETGHQNKAKRGWCWLFSSNNETLLKLTDSRGKKVLRNSIFGSSDNIIVTDRYAAYNYFAAENRQICWAHLARDFERLSHSCYPEIAGLGQKLKQSANQLFSFRKALLNDQINVLRFLRYARKLRKRSWYFLKKISYKTDAIHAMRVAKNMMKSENMMWKFLENPKEIPLTNNHAERQIRHYVVYRKNSYFTKAERGERFLERLISLYMTWKQQTQNPFQKLLGVLV